jgi:FkbM family methyltransferase
VIILTKSTSVTECIDYDYVVDLIGQAKTIAKNSFMNTERGFRNFNRVLTMIGRRINRILRKYGLEFKKYSRHKEHIYSVSDEDKSWTIDFLEYVLRFKPTLCLDIFDEKDKSEIIKFVRNKIYASLLNSIDFNLIFDDKDLYLHKKYKEMNALIKKRKNFYVLEMNGREYRLPINHFEVSVFYHKHGIPELPAEAIRALEGRDFIDGGAFIGDSALVLMDYKPRKIYAFEPQSMNYELLLKTIQLNNLSAIVTPVKKALGSAKGSLQITHLGSASVISDMFALEANEEVEVTPLDDFAEKNNLDVGLIKLDVEGYELEALKGSSRTIRKFKPVLAIAVYHRGADFFEIPKLVKALVPEYKLRFLNLNGGSIFAERVLLAYII